MTLNITNNGAAWTAAIEGRLDTATSVDFETKAEALYANADKNITIDCTALEYISSAGIRCFMTLRKAVTERGGSLVLTNLNAEIRSIFHLTHLEEAFGIK